MSLFSLALNKSAARHCKYHTGRGVIKFFESVEALAQYMGDHISKMETPIEAHGLASV